MLVRLSILFVALLLAQGASAQPMSPQQRQIYQDAQLRKRIEINKRIQQQQEYNAKIQNAVRAQNDAIRERNRQYLADQEKRRQAEQAIYAEARRSQEKYKLRGKPGHASSYVTSEPTRPAVKPKAGPSVDGGASYPTANGRSSVPRYRPRTH